MDTIWKEFIERESHKDYYKSLIKKVESDYNSGTVYPPKELIFNAYELTPYNSIRCVIIGQDPYFNPGEAHGLAFSVREGVKIPPSLRNIYKELEDEMGVVRESGDLTLLAKEGVFLLNKVLTVKKGEPNSHKGIGWLKFTESCIKMISERETPLVFMLWGAEAQKLSKLINERHLVLKAPHPSPLSSYRGFFGCGHFKKCNDFLISTGQDVIDWGKEDE